jgi:hypothetical protein
MPKANRKELNIEHIDVTVFFAVLVYFFFTAEFSLPTSATLLLY